MYKGRLVELRKVIDWYIPEMGAEVYYPSPCPEPGPIGKVRNIIHFLEEAPIIEIHPDKNMSEAETERIAAYLVEHMGWKIQFSTDPI